MAYSIVASKIQNAVINNSGELVIETQSQMAAFATYLETGKYRDLIKDHHFYIDLVWIDLKCTADIFG